MDLPQEEPDTESKASDETEDREAAQPDGIEEESDQQDREDAGHHGSDVGNLDRFWNCCKLPSAMDVATLQQLLREAEIRLYREEAGIVRQREMIATLRRQGHDAGDARACLRRLESSQARHIADRNRLFQALTDRSRH